MALTKSVTILLERGGYDFLRFDESAGPIPASAYAMRSERKMHNVSLNGVAYFIDRGIFPEFDERIDRHSSRSGGLEKDPTRARPEPDSSAEAELAAKMEARILEAIAILGG